MIHHRLGWLWAVVAGSLAASGAPAQEASRPSVTVGDQWQHVVYFGQRSASPNRTWTIKRVAPGEIEATEDDQPLRLTPDLNMIESPARRQSNDRALQFPLRVDDAWTYETQTVFKDNGFSTVRSTVSVKVLAYEKVAVVAGEFDAFKLYATGRFRGLSRGGPGILEGEFNSTYWYAPSVRTIVKSISTNPYRGTTHVELVVANLVP